MSIRKNIVAIEKSDFLTSLERPLEYWACMDGKRVDALLGPDVGRMVDFDQANPHHCYNLFLHSLHTVEGIVKKEDKMSKRVADLLKTAAFFHDLGKPKVARMKEGRKVFYGHPKVSVRLCRPVLQELDFAEEEENLICFWVGHHDDFIPYHVPERSDRQTNPYSIEINEETIRDYVTKTGKMLPRINGISEEEMWLGLFDLCYADASAQAEQVYMNGKLITTRQEKCENYERIKACFHYV